GGGRRAADRNRRCQADRGREGLTAPIHVAHRRGNCGTKIPRVRVSPIGSSRMERPMATHDLWRQAVRGLPEARTVSDADLLARFRDARDPAAFELLVYRHGPMVWATCRRLLRDHHAAEDAFQATFLALARQTGRIRASASVPAWLHRVAVRAGLDLLRRGARTPSEIDREREPIDPRPGPSDRAVVTGLP